MLHSSKEGYRYVASSAQLSQGLASEGVIVPPVDVRTPPGGQYDVIVVGAGYAALTAARDSALSGLSVLLLEARDRIGGRTWTSNVNGNLFEMGGTWIHHQQGFVWRELVRYGIDRDLKVSPAPSFAAPAADGKIVSHYKGKEYRMAAEDHGKFLDEALYAFCSVDGAGGSALIPFAGQLDNVNADPALVKQIDQLSLGDRIRQVEATKQLSDRQLAFVIPLFLLCSGGNVENSSLLEAIRWYRASNSTYQGMVDLLMHYKIGKGQSHLARCIFEEARSTGNLSFAFSSPVQSITDSQYGVKVETASGTYNATKVICTVPLNVMHKIKFSPPLPPLRAEACKIGHVNKGDKIHYELTDPQFRSWTGYSVPKGDEACLVNAFGEQTLKNGNVSVVAFSADAKDKHAPSLDSQTIIKRLAALEPGVEDKFVSAVFTEWYRDPWALGNWAMAPPDFLTRYQDALQLPHGNVHFASSDIAEGAWKSFIDGGCESGCKAAYMVKEELRTGPKASRL
ncbi:hypothetical protein JCM8547_001659 [Rhodosporidiobolus lusitaniae]